jgi:hypothetical protein
MDIGSSSPRYTVNDSKPELVQTDSCLFWAVLACATVMGCPVGTEDAEFFGNGVATRTTDRVELKVAG